MARPRNKTYTLKQKISVLSQAGLNPLIPENKASSSRRASPEPISSLSERIKKLLNIIQSSPLKATDMLALVMYDIEDNKVRALIAKYLIEKGCIRIQKSVYMLRAESKLFREISETLTDVQECYDNNDSILLVPIPVNTPGSMKIIGKDLQIDTLVKDPNVLFF